VALIILAHHMLPWRGGVERYMYELSCALQDRGEELVIVATDCEGATDFDSESHLTIERVPAKSNWQAAQALAAAAIDYVNGNSFNESVTAILAGTWRPEGLAGWLVRRRTGLPYVVIAHDREAVRTGHNILKWATQHLVIRGAAGGAAVSHYAASVLRCRGLSEEEIALVYGGVNPRAFAVDEQDVAELRTRLSDCGQPILLTVARLVHSKGHSQVIVALPQVLEQVGEVKYVIVGSGEEKENLQQLVEKKGLSEIVTFWGRAPDAELAALYHAADLFIMPSRDMNGKSREGLGLTYLEAGLCGLPAIGSRSGGVPDAIVDGETGLLVNPEDPAQIADAIIRLISDEALAQRLGQNARRRVLDDFTWERVAERFQAALSRWGLVADSSIAASTGQIPIAG